MHWFSMDVNDIGGVVEAANPPRIEMKVDDGAESGRAKAYRPSMNSTGMTRGII